MSAQETREPAEPRPTPVAAERDGLPWEQRRWAILAIAMAVAMSSLDSSIANVALPTMAADLKVSPAQIVWVVNAVQISMVATLLPLAALGEIVGHQRIYYGGLVLFGVGALGCAAAQSFEMLVAARLVQGLGSSGMMSVNSALIRFIWPKRILGRGVGVNAMVVSTGITLGPTVASIILSVAPWHWLFAVNIPFVVIAIVLSATVLPPMPRAPHKFDFLGALLTAGCMGMLVFALGSAARAQSIVLTIGELALSLVCGVLLIRRQKGHPAPMIPVDLFKIPIFALSVMTAICSFATQGLAYVSLPFLLIGVLGRSQVETGFLITPWPVVVAIMAPIAGSLADRYRVGLLGGIGLAILSIGMLLLATIPRDAGVLDIAWRLALCGCGFGFFQSPNMKALLLSAPASRAGGASGMVATARLTGQTIGAALAAFCFSIGNGNGPLLALSLGVAFAAVGSAASFMRLRFRNDGPVVI
jgi:DHA2 family multidrug resistance protein-like MFS transporter